MEVAVLVNHWDLFLSKVDLNHNDVNDSHDIFFLFSMGIGRGLFDERESK